MPSDALHYSFIAAELDSLLSDGRIDKISMPEKDEIILGIRSRGTNFSLLISASPSCARCHLTRFKKENPLAAPSFLMHLRKHIGGAKIVSVKNPHCERILLFELITRNELSDEEHLTLVAEIMGKYSNIILVGADGKISDCIRKVGIDLSSKRQVLPGLTYFAAPSQDRLSPTDRQAVKLILQDFRGGDLPAYLIRNLKGLAPVSAEEAVLRAIGKTESEALSSEEVEKIASELAALYDKSTVRPCTRLHDGKSTDFFIRPYLTFSGEWKYFSTLNEAMDEFFNEKDAQMRFNEKSKHLVTVLKNAISRTQKKLGGFLQKQQDCKNLEQDKLFGELLISNLYRIKTPAESVTLENWYDGGNPVTVPLPKGKTPQAAAQSYFKSYAKKKKTLQQLETLIADAEDTLDYYESIMTSFSLCRTDPEIDELGEELTKAGLLKKTTNKKNVKKAPRPSSHLSVEIDGFTVKVGKNNIQNDALTKSARAEDMWLHTRSIHGSHVIIVSNGKKIPDGVILKAAALAAKYSKAALSQNVPVDYTLVKYVNKPAGAPLGKVIYTHQSTVFVDPAE